jgi:polyisoprenoid-binding protein YceI
MLNFSPVIFKINNTMLNKSYLITILAFLFAFSTATAQDVTYQLSEIHQFKIDGDSNVRSWDADITEADASLVLTGVDNLSIENLTEESFKSFKISIPVEGIESDSRRLTRNLQGYLREDDFPVITFELQQINSITYENGSAQISADGIINAAGVENSVSMDVEATVNGNGSITFSGVQRLLMTDFDIDPPTAVMGTVRADDEIDIIYQVTFAR